MRCYLTLLIACTNTSVPLWTNITDKARLCVSLYDKNGDNPGDMDTKTVKIEFVDKMNKDGDEK